MNIIDSNSNFNTIPLTYYKSMNMGLYKYTFLLNNKNKIFELRSFDFPQFNQIEYLKKLGVLKEDFIFYLDNNNRLEVNNKYFKNSFIHTSTKDRLLLNNGLPSIIYNNSKIYRITEYFSSLDFYKYKANWELKENYTLDP